MLYVNGAQNKIGLECGILYRKNLISLTNKYLIQGRTVQAIEFESTIYNGHIEIPKLYSNWEGRHVKVILLVEDQASEQKDEKVFKVLTELSDDFSV